MEYTRLSIQGSTRRVDVVVPDDEPLEALLGEILDVLDEPADGARPVVLTTLLGEQLDPSRTLDEQAVAPGAMLRIVPVDEAPPSPDIAEVTEAVTEAEAVRHDRWSTRHAAATAGIGGAALALAGAGRSLSADGVAPWHLLVAAALAAAGAAVLARRGKTTAAVALGGVGVGVALPAAIALAGGAELSPRSLVAAVGAAAAVVATVALGGFRAVGLALGALLLVGAAAWAALAETLGLDVVGTVALLGLASVLLIGLLPGIALSLSGLTGFDDLVLAGQRVDRARVRGSIDAAYATLTATTVSAAVVSSVCAAVLAARDDGWSLGLAATIVVVLALRARMLPLGPQRLAVLVAAAAPVATWLALGAAPTGWAVAAAALLALAIVAVATWRPTLPVAARLRRLATIVEALAVVAMVPLLLGQLGILRDLAETFG